jgi:hypothetical protein
MATDLFTPILNDRTRAPYFFNGRLVTGEVMTDEQRAQRVAHEIIAHGLGDGVAYGLEVTASTNLNSVDTPAVTVKTGAAINRKGDLLYLATDTDVQLVRPAHASKPAKKIFEACTPPQQGAYVADAGVYLLTIAPTTIGNGLAPVNGLGAENSCNVKYRVDAVQFRLNELTVDPSLLTDAAQMRNRIAYACFGFNGSDAYSRDPFAEDTTPISALDALRGTTTISDCDVPLAVMYWSATTGISFIDMWAVRRRLTRTRPASVFEPFTDTGRALSEAMVLQFQDHLSTLRKSLGQASVLEATNHFRFLPPVGLVPVATTKFKGTAANTFFRGITTRRAAHVEGARLGWILRQGLEFLPIDTTSGEMLWLYLVRENRRAIDTDGKAAPQPAIVFASGHIPYRGDPHFDVAKWDYSNYL